MTRVCIYCLETKEAASFNVEHVLPQAFGRFENNVTLDCVCAACNQVKRGRLEPLGVLLHGA